MANTPDHQQQQQLLISLVNTPDDVLHEIFIRLPAKLLARMRCVSKHWNGFLTAPSFIKSHLDHSINTNKEILLQFKEGFFSKYENPCTAEYSLPPNRELRNFLKFPVNTPSFINFYLIGSVNGLICFVDGGSLNHPTCCVNIWNPSLSALLSLPSYTIGSLSDKRYLRFGYDPKADDYKVVKVIGLKGSNIINGWQVEVYSMRKGSWEVITERFPFQVTKLCEDTLGVGWHDGHVHWLGQNHMTQQLTIVAFGLHEKTFCEIAAPDCVKQCGWLSGRGRGLINLGMWNDKLCLMSHTRRGNLELWLMNEYKVAESWVRSYIFKDFLSHDKSPFRFTVDNGYLFESYRNRLSLYDPVDKSFKYVVRVTDRSSRIVRYVDSLVWVSPSKSGSPVAATADSKLKRKISVIDDES